MKRISLNWKLLVFSILFLFVFIYLGSWQLERGVQKVAWIEADKQRRLQPGISLIELPDSANELKRLNGQPVQLQGSYEDGVLFLLDNRVLHGEVGFEVLVPFRDRSGRVVLINRGFVPQGRTRLDKPKIPPLSEFSGSLTGNIYVPDSGVETHKIIGCADTLCRAIPRYWGHCRGSAAEAVSSCCQVGRAE